MTKARWFLALAILVFGSAGVALFLKEFQRHVAGETTPMSSKARKLASFDKHVHLQGKSGGIVDIEISAPNKDSDVQAGSMIELVAQVTARKTFDTLEYAWLLPEGVNAVSGATEGQFTHMERGETVELRLSVVKSTDANRQIHLHVFQMIGDKRIGKMAQYNTVDQEKIDEDLRTKAEMLRERMPASDPDRQFKLMQ